jgi:hypothetical protein
LQHQQLLTSKNRKRSNSTVSSLFITDHTASFSIETWDDKRYIISKGQRISLETQHLLITHPSSAVFSPSSESLNLSRASSKTWGSWVSNHQQRNKITTIKISKEDPIISKKYKKKNNVLVWHFIQGFVTTLLHRFPPDSLTPILQVGQDGWVSLSEESILLN